MIPLADILPGLSAAQSPPGGLLSAYLDPTGRSISLADYFRFMREVALRSGDETFALSERPMTAGTAQLVFASAGRQHSLAEAMRQIAQAYNVFHGGAYNRVEQRGARIVYVIDDEHFPYTRARDDYVYFALECALIFAHGALCEMAGADLTPSLRRVVSRRPTGCERLTQALAFWAAPVRRGGAVFELSYDIAIAGRSVTHRRDHMAPDLAVHNRIISLIEARLDGPAQESLARRVARALADGLKEQGEIADRLGVSVATLRRRLDDEGESFRGLKQQAMNDQARQQLSQGASVSDVAQDLGFSDMRAFTRAFKSWNGVTPSAFAHGRLAGEAGGEGP